MRRRRLLHGGQRKNCRPKLSGIALLTARRKVGSKSIPGAMRLRKAITEIFIISDGILVRSMRTPREPARLECWTFWGTDGNGLRRHSVHLMDLNPFRFIADIRRISSTVNIS